MTPPLTPEQRAEQLVRLHDLLPCSHVDGGVCRKCQIMETADALRHVERETWAEASKLVDEHWKVDKHRIYSGFIWNEYRKDIVKEFRRRSDGGKR